MPGRSAAPNSARSQVADLTEVPDGLRILIRRSKGDQEGQGQEVAIPRGYRLRPVEAVQTWLAAAEISAGPVFRAVGRGGRVSCEALADDSAARIVKRYARRVGLDAGAYSGHSLRSGFLTSAAESGASVFKMTEVSRHQLARHAARLCPPGRSVQGARGGGVPVGSVPEMAVWLQARRLASHSPGECLLARLSGGTLRHRRVV